MKFFLNYFFVLATIIFSFRTPLVKCSNLVGLLTLSRHGQRTPVVSLPKDTTNIEWNAEPGQLLNSGKVLHYDLGKWFRKRYDKFLSKEYSLKEIHIQSTDVDRVLMSAYCNLAGLYPPKGKDIWKRTINWQPIPVHIMPNYYLLTESLACDKFLPLWTNYFEKSPEINNEKNKKLFHYISENLDEDVSKNPLSLVLYHDAIYTRKFNGYEVPEWADSVYDQWTDVVKLIFQSMSNSTELAQMTLGGFAGHIINHFDSVINGSDKYKYSMNFAHDINVAGLLNVLTNNKAILPFYGSTLLFELHKNSDKHYLKLFFKNQDQPVEIQIKECGVKCDYSSFKKLLKKHVTSEDKWKKICLKK